MNEARIYLARFDEKTLDGTINFTLQKPGIFHSPSPWHSLTERVSDEIRCRVAAMIVNVLGFQVSRDTHYLIGDILVHTISYLSSITRYIILQISLDTSSMPANQLPPHHHRLPHTIKIRPPPSLHYSSTHLNKSKTNNYFKHMILPPSPYTLCIYKPRPPHLSNIVVDIYI